MLPKYHIIFGFIFSAVLFFFFPDINLFVALIIFFSSFLIDIDHYIYYVIKKKDFSIKNSIKYFLEKRKDILKMGIKKRKEFYSAFCFLHGIEIIILLFIAGIFISRYFLFILVGFTFHLLLDISEEVYNNLRIDKISIIYTFFKFKKLKNLK